MKKFIVIAFMALAVTMIATVPAKASDVTPTATPTPSPRVTSLVPPGNGSGGRISVGTIFDYYNNVLTSDQKQIADYLIGMYNYMYMGARGFIYENVNTAADLVVRLQSFGNRFWGTTLEGNASRLDSNMQQFMSAIISYAGTIDASFGTWVNSIADSGLVIPYTKDSLNSWTNYYNDPSALGVENWGHYYSDWESGSFYDFPFVGFAWVDSSYENEYNDFVLNQSPIIYTNTYQANSSNTNCAMISLKDVPVYDSLFILRSQSGSVPHSFRYGSYNNGLINYGNNLNARLIIKNGQNKIYVSSTSGGISDCKYNNTIMTYNNNSSLSELIDQAFKYTPFLVEGNTAALQYYHYIDFYPYFNHVYLVDDLDTLANIEEIFNDSDLGINGQNAIWIQEPTDDDLYWQIEPTLIQGDEWDNNLVHGDLTPIDEGDLTQNIVNNTVINNYEILAPGTVINVPVNWLDSEGNYLEYTNNTALPFFVMVGDIFNALGEIRIFIVGVLILGLAGGVLVKFLL